MEENKKLNEEKEIEGCTFKPEFVNQNKSFIQNSNIEKPRGYDQTVVRLRKGIIENFKKKYLIEKYFFFLNIY